MIDPSTEFLCPISKEAIEFYSYGWAAIENKKYVLAKEFFNMAIETKKPGELSEDQIQLAQYHIHKISGKYQEAMLCLIRAVLLKSPIALNEFKNFAFLPIDEKTHDDNKLFLLSVCAALAMGFSGQSDMFFGGLISGIINAEYRLQVYLET